VAVKQVRVSDLSGRQATEEQFAKLIVHEHPKYQGPIILATGPNPATPNHSQGNWTTRPASRSSRSAPFRNEIHTRLHQLLTELVPAPASSADRLAATPT
jgi:hypothetical protein